MVSETCLSAALPAASTPTDVSATKQNPARRHECLRMALLPFSCPETDPGARHWFHARVPGMRHILPAAFAAALVFACRTAGATPFAESQRLHSLDVFQLEYADDVQISPDGSRIVYVRASHDIMTDRVRRNLWIIDADGANNRPLRSEVRSFSSPRWSPDGTRIAYV